MLPAPHRMRLHREFDQAVRRGRRAGGRYLVVHLWVPADVASSAPDVGSPGQDRRVRVGLVVSRAVGNAVVRNQVKRRLRAQLTLRLGRLPVGSLVVVRAQAAVNTLSSAGMGEALDRALGRLLPLAAT